MIQSLLLALSLGVAAPAAAQPAVPTEPVVHAVIFYSPTCPHCHEVLTEDLPPLMQKYGDRLIISGVNVTTPQGQHLYQATVDFFKIPDSRLGVPTLVVGSEVMVGSEEIPRRFPGLIEKGLAEGGTDWPPVPAIQQALSPREPAAAPAPEDTSSTEAGAPPPATSVGRLDEEAPSTGPWARFLLDPMANGVAVLVFLGMLVAVVSSLRAVAGTARPPLTLPVWATPVLASVGMAVASYLAWVELRGSVAVCGPLGDCNTVQQSPYALILGIPVGVLGQAGYLGMFVAWALGVLGPRSWRDSAWLALWAMGLVGVVFSAYLTFLEPFVIGATCAWCLASAVLMTLILLGATPAVASQRK